MERKWLADRRKEQGFTQRKLANIVGTSDKHISNIEKGYRDPSGALALKIAKALGFDMMYFFAHEVHSENKNQRKIS